MAHSILHSDSEFDAEGWLRISYPPVYTKSHDGVLLSFLGNLDSPNPIQNIINHFHSSINDKQIRNVIKYFSNAIIPWHGEFYKYDHPSIPNFHVIQKDLKFASGKIDKVFFGISLDEYFNEFRICWIRIINQHWNIKKTIYAIDDKKYDWRRIQDIF